MDWNAEAEVTTLRTQMSPSPQTSSVRAHLRMVFRHKLIIAVAMLAGLGIALLIGMQAIPRYEAETQIVLDVRNTRVVKFDAVLSNLPPAPEVLRTEMDVISSRSMAERVADH